jgi:membrane protein
VPRRETRRNTLKMKAAGIWDILSDTVKNYSNNGDGNQAAAIALYTILSVIPLFILTIIAAGALFVSYPDIQTNITSAIKNFHPYFSEKLLKQLGQIEGKSQVLGWLGVGALVWLSAAIFNSIESALDIIFRSRQKRNYVVSKLMAICMIPMGWIIGGLSVVISYVAALFANKPLVIPGGMEISLSFAAEIVLRYIVPYLMTVILATAVYRIVPTAKIRFGVALTGSAIFSLLVEIAKQFFTWYMTNYTRYDVIFGSLEAIVILVIWVFYVALIFLFCAEMMSSYQRRDLLLLEKALLKPHHSRLQVDERLFNKFGQTYPKDSIIFNEGDPGREMFYILSGHVCLERVDCQVKKTLAEMGPGQYFGEMAALIDITRSATARALQDCHLAVIDAATFRNLIRESHEVGLFMLKEFSRRLKKSNFALDELTNLWTRLVIIMHFLDQTQAGIEEHIPELVKLTQKEPAEIRELIYELSNQGTLILKEGLILEVVREKMWLLLNSGALKQCFIEDEDKV